MAGESSGSAMAWLPIRYRDFYHIPRMFLVQKGNETYLFHCAFEDESDGYSSLYHVYKLNCEAVPEDETASWTDLPHAGVCVRDIPTGAAEFDESRRSLVRASLFNSL
jgi:hypothetical protein